jgi:hypothetical protein
MTMIYMLTSDVGYFAPTDFTGTVTEKGIGEGTNTETPKIAIIAPLFGKVLKTFVGLTLYTCS